MYYITVIQDYNLFKRLFQIQTTPSKPDNDWMKNLDDSSQAVLKTMELLHVGNIEKGATMAGEYKSLSLCWFGSKKYTYMSEKINSVDGDETCFISHDSLDSFHFKWWTKSGIEFYRILGIFIKPTANKIEFMSSSKKLSCSKNGTESWE